MIQTTLDRLRSRGEVRIDADSDGYVVAWWPKGQMGNPLCGRGGHGSVLEPILLQLEEATRPPWYGDVDDVRAARERKTEHDRLWNQRIALGVIDREDRRRERRALKSEEWRVQRRIEIERRERSRVQRVLTGTAP